MNRETHKRTRREDSVGDYPSKKQKSTANTDEGHFHYKIGEVLDKRYEINSFLGDGTFSKVVKCWDLKDRNYVALKIIRSINRYIQAAREEIQSFSILNKLNCKYLIRLKDTFVHKTHPVLVFPLYGKDLYNDIIERNKKGYSFRRLKRYCYQMLRAVEEIHRVGLIHTDLKPENILQDHSRDNVVVSDFGSMVEKSHSSLISTRQYRSPECILDLKWDEKVDIWSLGCIFFEIKTGNTMFSTHEDLEHLAIMEKYLGEFPSNMVNRVPTYMLNKFFKMGKLNWPRYTTTRKSYKYVSKLETIKMLIYDEKKFRDSLLFIDLIQKMLKLDPFERISASEALDHQFFQ